MAGCDEIESTREQSSLDQQYAAVRVIVGSDSTHKSALHHASGPEPMPMRCAFLVTKSNGKMSKFACISQAQGVCEASGYLNDADRSTDAKISEIFAEGMTPANPELPFT